MLAVSIVNWQIPSLRTVQWSLSPSYKVAYIFIRHQNLQNDDMLLLPCHFSNVIQHTLVDNLCVSSVLIVCIHTHTHTHTLTKHCSESSAQTFITQSACMLFLQKAHTLLSSVCYYSICSLIITNEHTHSVGSASRLVEVITAAKLFWLDPWFPTTSHQSQRPLAPYSALIKWFDFTLCSPPSVIQSLRRCASLSLMRTPTPSPSRSAAPG